MADRYRDVAREALQHQDYRNLRKLVIASSMGYTGETDKFLDLPFSYTEKPNQGLTVVTARTMVLPQEVMPLAIRAYDKRDTLWEIEGQPLEKVPFNTGDDPKTWIAAVYAAYKLQYQVERKARRLEHMESMAQQSLEDLETAKVDLSCLSEQEVEADLLKWQEDGLLDQDNRGLLVWKAVTKDRCGVLGYQYTIDKPFVNGGMSAVGPWGAVKEYGHRGNYVLALRITEGGPVHAAQRPGVWYAIKGVPVAQYLITEMTEDGFVPVLVAGTDEMAILTGIPSKRGDIPQAPVVFANDDDYSF